MSTPSSDFGLRDNHSRGSVAEFLQTKIQAGSNLFVVSAYFTIYAYDALRGCLEGIGHLDFLFGEPSFVNRLDPGKTEAKRFVIDADGLDLANKLQQKRVARQCAEWVERTFQRKAALSLLGCRSAVLPSVAETPTSRADESGLVTWLAVMEGTP